jgi:hypothetical protein
MKRRRFTIAEAEMRIPIKDGERTVAYVALARDDLERAHLLAAAPVMQEALEACRKVLTGAPSLAGLAHARGLVEDALKTSEGPGMTDIDDTRRVALDLLREDCKTLADTMRALGYPKAEVSYSISGYAIALHTDVNDGRPATSRQWAVHRGPDFREQAAAWTAALPKIQTPEEITAEIAPWFIDRATGRDRGGSAGTDNHDGAAATSSTEFPRPSPPSAADDGAPASAPPSERDAVEPSGCAP